MRLTIEKVEAVFRTLGPCSTAAFAKHIGIGSTKASKSLYRWRIMGLLIREFGRPCIWSLNTSKRKVKTLKKSTRPDADAEPSAERIAEMERIKAEIHAEKMAEGPPDRGCDYGRHNMKVVTTKMLPSRVAKIISQ
jgi:hypothetical protein